MTNKIGIVKETPCGKIIVPDKSIDLPEIYQGVSAGCIAYLDKQGKLCFMDEDPHDYR